MSKAAITTGIVLGFMFLVGVWFFGNYNSLITSREQVANAWAKVETQYQRRFDLIDNLVSSVKGAQGQEREVFIKIAEARTRYNNAKTVDEKTAATNDIETNVALLPRLQEAYPILQSNDTVKSLMSELAGTENGVATARDTFNNTATNYNIGIQRFPKNLFANMFGFEKATLFKSDAGASKAPKVTF